MNRQPPPHPGEGDVWREVIASLDGAASPAVLALMEARRQVGIDRYGVPLQRGNGRDARRDLMEELLDAVAYSALCGEPIGWLVEGIERLTDDGRCVEGGAWCSEPARATGPARMTWPDHCERMAWERADRVEPRGVVPVPSAWGPSTTAAPTHGRCG